MKKILLLLLFFLLFFSCENQSTETANKEVTLTGNETVAVEAVAETEAPRYEKMNNAPELPPEHSLDTVLLTEFIDFGCPHCYRFNSILPDIQNHFREKLKVETYIVPWRGDNVVKAFYFAELQGKGDEFKLLMFRLFHDSNIKNINNPDVIITVLNELKLTKDSDVKLDALFNVPEINEKFKEGSDKIRSFKITGTPTVIIENSVKAEWSKENLMNLINFLLK